MKCVFCEGFDDKQRIIIKNELSKAFLSYQPIVPGHTLIIPKRCVAKFSDLTFKEKESIFELTDKVVNSLKKSFNAEGFNYAWNENIVAGQSVLHFHLHIVPRKKGDNGILEYEPRKFLYRPGSREILPSEELEKVTNLIKDNLSQ